MNICKTGSGNGAGFLLRKKCFISGNKDTECGVIISEDPKKRISKGVAGIENESRFQSGYKQEKIYGRIMKKLLQFV